MRFNVYILTENPVVSGIRQHNFTTIFQQHFQQEIGQWIEGK